MKFDKTQKRALVFVAGLLGLSWYMGGQFEKADMMRSEADAYTYAYNEGHSDSRKDEDYQPVLASAREEGRFRKILKQRAENDDFITQKMIYNMEQTLDSIWRCGDRDEVSIKHIYYSLGALADGRDWNTQTDYTSMNQQNKVKRKWRKIQAKRDELGIDKFKKLIDSTRYEVGRWDLYSAETFASPDDYCSACHVDGDNSTGRMYLVCDDCGGSYGAETFNAPYAGSGSLMNIGKDTSLGNFTSKELTQSSAIHGDFNEASLNYSGHQNLQVRGAETFEAIERFDRDRDDFIGEKSWEGFSPYAFQDASRELYDFIHDSKLDDKTKMAMVAIINQGKDNLGKMYDDSMEGLDAENFDAETMTPSEVKVKVTKDVTPKGSKIIVEECVDIQAHKADATANFYRVRFRDPAEMSNFRVPAWAARAANTMGSKYYDVAGSKVTMGQDKSGNWKIQSVMIPKRANVDVDLALKIANHIQDRLEKEGRWASKECQDNERVLIIR